MAWFYSAAAAWNWSALYILGLPGALTYFLAVGTCITASLIAAYLVDRSSAEIAA